MKHLSHLHELLFFTLTEASLQKGRRPTDRATASHKKSIQSEAFLGRLPLKFIAWHAPDRPLESVQSLREIDGVQKCEAGSISCVCLLWGGLVVFFVCGFLFVCLFLLNTDSYFCFHYLGTDWSILLQPNMEICECCNMPTLTLLTGAMWMQWH